MAETWISPWTGNQLSAEQLIREVTLDALSQLYVASTLGLPEPTIAVGDESVIIRTSPIDYTHEIFFPRDLRDLMNQEFAGHLASVRSEIGFGSDITSSTSLRGEMIGEMLRYFNALERLIRMVAVNHNFSPTRVLALHGLSPALPIATMTREFAQAGMHYLIMYPLAEESGAGVFMSIRVDTAIRMMNDLWHGRPDSIRSCFGLARDYGKYAWVSDNDNWAVD